MRAARFTLIAVAISGLTGVAMPAHAATTDSQTCTVSVALPAKLVIRSWNSIVTAQLNDPDACAEYATWKLVKGSEDAASLATFSSPATVDRVSFYTAPSGNHPGTYSAVGSYAYSEETYENSDGYDESVTVLQQDSGPMVAKYASKLSWVSTRRAGSKVTLQARASRYVTSAPSAFAGGYVTWKKAKVLVQKRVGTAWKTVKTVHTDSKGLATAHLTGATASWRLITTDAPTIWGSATGTRRR